MMMAERARDDSLEPKMLSRSMTEPSAVPKPVEMIEWVRSIPVIESSSAMVNT